MADANLIFASPSSRQVVQKWGLVWKIMLMRWFFARQFVPKRHKCALIAELNLIFSSRSSARKRFGMEISVKNHADAWFSHTAICFWAKTNSFDGRREIAFANFSSPLRDKVAQKWGILWIQRKKYLFSVPEKSVTIQTVFLQIRWQWHLKSWDICHHFHDFYICSAMLWSL